VTAQRYRELREDIGSQNLVAKLLGVDKRTIQRRENGELKITREAELAILCLHHSYFFAKIFRFGPFKAVQ
jgi:DNA-binding XRE family transcriptional regulator